MELWLPLGKLDSFSNDADTVHSVEFHGLSHAFVARLVTCLHCSRLVTWICSRLVACLCSRLVACLCCQLVACLCSRLVPVLSACALTACALTACALSACALPALLRAFLCSRLVSSFSVRLLASIPLSLDFFGLLGLASFSSFYIRRPTAVIIWV